MNNFYAQYTSIQPYLQRKEDVKYGEKQYIQSIEDRAKLVSYVNALTGSENFKLLLIAPGFYM